MLSSMDYIPRKGVPATSASTNSSVNFAKNRLSRVRGTVKKVEEAIAGGKKADAEAALKAATPEVMRGAQKGVMHKNAASRKVSRLTLRVRAMQG